MPDYWGLPGQGDLRKEIITKWCRLFGEENQMYKTVYDQASPEIYFYQLENGSLPDVVPVARLESLMALKFVGQIRRFYGPKTLKI